MQEIIKALSWTFVHSLWQGLFAALLAAIIIGLTRQTAARFRYNLLGIVMILFFVSSVITFILQLNGTPKTGISSSLNEETLIAATRGSSEWMDNVIGWVNANSNLLVWSWASCFLFSCLRFVTGLAGVNRLRYYKTVPINCEWQAKLEELKRMIGLRRSVVLLQSELVKIPLALGNLKPVILLPLGLLSNLPPEQVETILLHELAHIRRKDYLVNLLQHIVEAIFFFNPALRWLSSLIREEREACCDDMVMARCSQKANYFNALIGFQEYSMRQHSYAMGISSKKQYLLNRVKRMITNRNKGTSFFEKMALLAGVILFSAFGFVTREKPAQEKTLLTMQAPGDLVLSPPVKPETTAEQNTNFTIQNRTRVDSVPVKKPGEKKAMKNKRERPGKPGQWDKPAESRKPYEENKPEKDPQKLADATLNEIIKIKNEIGVKKEVIGVKKEQLKDKNGQEKNSIQKEIDKERDDVEGKRDELNRLRAKWDALKIESQKDAKGDGKGDGKGEGKGDGKGDDKQELQYKIGLKLRNAIPRTYKPYTVLKPKPPETIKKKVSLAP